MIPMIGSICQGSLGVCHLPRTWWKVLTRAVDLLDPAYPDNSGGLDTWCLEAIEMDVDQTYKYLRSELPDYVSFERWILDQKDGHLPTASLARFNEIIRYRRHIRPHKITETYADIGLDPKVHTYTSALLLNTLQDWQLFHARDYSDTDAGTLPAGMPPLISSLDVGPLKIMQLPRTWYKCLLETKGLLHSDYPACGGGLDQGVLDAVGLDRDKTLAYIRDARPDYMAFEAWVTAQVGSVDRDRITAFENTMLKRQHAEAKRGGIHQLTGCDPSIKDGVTLNHLEDWRYAYDIAVAPLK
jgi:hypothetical protein